MNRSEFINVMKNMKLQYKKREILCDKINEFCGMKLVEEIYETDFLKILVPLIESAIGDRGKNITYLVYECGFDLAIMGSRIENYDGSPVILKDFGDLYDFITYDDMEDDIND